MILLDTILIKPLKEKTYTQQQVALDDEKNKGKDPIKDDMDIKHISKKIPYEIQKAVVVQIAHSLTVPYFPGDVVYYYTSRKGIPYRWVKDTYLVKSYDIIGYEKVL